MTRVAIAIAWIGVAIGAFLIGQAMGGIDGYTEGYAAAVDDREPCSYGPTTPAEYESAIRELQAKADALGARIMRMEGDMAHDSAYYERALRIAREKGQCGLH